MEKKHLQRVDRMILLTQIVVFIFSMAGLAAQLTMAKMAPILSILPMIFMVISFLTTIGLYPKYQGTVVYSRTVAAVFAAGYAVMLMTAQTGTPYPYLIPLLILVVISLDMVTVKILGAVFAVLNIAKVLVSFLSASDP